MITQSACVFFDRWPRPAVLREHLEPLGSLSRRRVDGGLSLALPLGDEGRAELVVDPVSQPWPDLPPEGEEEVATERGLAPPGSLTRALQHSWTWKEARRVVPRHQGFTLIRCDWSAEHLDARQPVQELIHLTRVAAALLEAPGALCWFGAPGEALRPSEAVRGALRRIGPGPVPIDLWTNIRLLQLGAGWRLVDTVGMGQLELPDLEACHAEGRYDHREVDAFLRNLQLYLLDRGEVIRDGDSMPGPGGARWSGRAFSCSLAEPPRRVIRLFPHDQSQPPRMVLEGG